MKLQQAREFGKVCGLGEDREHVNNILHNATSLFSYSEMEREIDELTEEAEKAGLKMCGCGCVDNEPKELCYICEKLKGVKNG